jgi:hypothetical protein
MAAPPDMIKIQEIQDNEPDGDLVESIAHDWFAIEDIAKAVPDAFKKPALNLQVGRTSEIGDNTFAVILGGGWGLTLKDAFTTHASSCQVADQALRIHQLINVSMRSLKAIGMGHPVSGATSRQSLRACSVD